MSLSSNRSHAMDDVVLAVIENRSIDKCSGIRTEHLKRAPKPYPAAAGPAPSRPSPVDPDNP